MHAIKIIYKLILMHNFGNDIMGIVLLKASLDNQFDYDIDTNSSNIVMRHDQKQQLDHDQQEF